MRTVTLILLAVGATVDAGAQPARRRASTPLAEETAGPPAVVSMIIDARRELNLTPRQLATLDSIERNVVAERRRVAERIRARRDSLCANREPCELSTSERAAFRDWVEDQRPSRTQRLRQDSLIQSRVMAVLDSSQRTMVRSRLEHAPRRGRGRGQVGVRPWQRDEWEGPPGRAWGPAFERGRPRTYAFRSPDGPPWGDPRWGLPGAQRYRQVPGPRGPRDDFGPRGGFGRRWPDGSPYGRGFGPPVGRQRGRPGDVEAPGDTLAEPREIPRRRPA
jgi:hypothetical protein